MRAEDPEIGFNDDRTYAYADASIRLRYARDEFNRLAEQAGVTDPGFCRPEASVLVVE